MLPAPSPKAAEKPTDLGQMAAIPVVPGHTITIPLVRNLNITTDNRNGPANDPPRTPTLSPQDQAALTELLRKQQLVLDRVVGVARQYITGLIITGRGGIGKSWLVTKELERLGIPYVLHNSHVTARGLLDELKAHPDAIHIIEDAEQLIRNLVALGILRSATWPGCRGRSGRLERLITWRTHRESLEVVFTGNIILISNRELGKLPEMQALATRVPHIEFTVSDAEVAALMRSIALLGHRIGDAVLGPEECLEVAEFIIAESVQLSRPLDVRMLVNGFADRLQAEDGEAGCSWRDLVRSTLLGKPDIADDVESAGVRAQTNARELAIAREIGDLDPHERLAVWTEKTGKSRAALYRTLAKLGRIDALGQ